MPSQNDRKAVEDFLKRVEDCGERLKGEKRELYGELCVLFRGNRKEVQALSPEGYETLYAVLRDCKDDYDQILLTACSYHYGVQTLRAIEEYFRDKGKKDQGTATPQDESLSLLEGVLKRFGVPLFESKKEVIDWLYEKAKKDQEVLKELVWSELLEDSLSRVQDFEERAKKAGLPEGDLQELLKSVRKYSEDLRKELDSTYQKVSKILREGGFEVEPKELKELISNLPKKGINWNAAKRSLTREYEATFYKRHPVVMAMMMMGGDDFRIRPLDSKTRIGPKESIRILQYSNLLSRIRRYLNRLQKQKVPEDFPEDHKTFVSAFLDTNIVFLGGLILLLERFGYKELKVVTDWSSKSRDLRLIRDRFSSWKDANWEDRIFKAGEVTSVLDFYLDYLAG